MPSLERNGDVYVLNLGDDENRFNADSLDALEDRRSGSRPGLERGARPVGPAPRFESTVRAHYEMCSTAFFFSSAWIRLYTTVPSFSTTSVRYTLPPVTSNAKASV